MICHIIQHEEQDKRRLWYHPLQDNKETITKKIKENRNKNITFHFKKDDKSHGLTIINQQAFSSVNSQTQWMNMVKWEKRSSK